MIEILGYISALFVGVSLGLIGGGGSILAVPILAYLFGLDEKVSTGYSLFIVGLSALVGGLRQNKQGNVDWKIAVIFGIPAIIGVWLVRTFVVPNLPEIIFTIYNFEFTRRMGMFGLFSILMIAAAYKMIAQKTNPTSEKNNKKTFNYPLIILEGLIVGGVTGLVGAGGGFLIIPALVLLADIEMKKAVGTSLIIIAAKSLLGFLLGDALQMQIDWSFLAIFSSIAIIGIFIGVYLGNFIDGKKLKKGFGYFIIIMAIFIFIMEFIVKT